MASHLQDNPPNSFPIQISSYVFLPSLSFLDHRFYFSLDLPTSSLPLLLSLQLDSGREKGGLPALRPFLCFAHETHLNARSLGRSLRYRGVFTAQVPMPENHVMAQAHLGVHAARVSLD
jgi:hypothetical protein